MTGLLSVEGPTDATRGRVNPGPCAHCQIPARLDGADQCLGWLPGVMNACCGHGEGRWAYVQFSSRFRISGYVARTYQWVLVRFRDLFYPSYAHLDHRSEGESWTKNS